ncbi:MAG: hypothetical protein MPW14_08625 [Candidatus Manganitrophus sp.]|nr:hypothetical protein [Candidatus Manganitrophus sp.]WDT81762.1 MAG: hypothetical protein MPW14_08625 [Candidatus Manganitrophus sp.]
MLDIVLLFLFGLLVLVLRYTGGKGFGVSSREEEKRVVDWARLLVLLAFATAFLIFFILNNRE